MAILPLPMNLFDQLHYARARGSYQPFSYRLHVADRHLPIVAHEWLHHWQNVTTVLGAERLLAFLNALSSLSRLIRASECLALPLHKHHPDIAEFHQHLRMAIYWQRSEPYPKSQTAGMEGVSKEDAGTVCVIPGDPDGMREEHLLCSVVGLDEEEIIAYPLAGHSICEGSAFSLERLLSGEDHRAAAPSASQWAYQTLPFAVSYMSEMPCEREASLLIGELALCFGSPGISVVRLLKQLEEEKPTGASLPWLKGWVKEQIRTLRPEIEEAAQLEIEAIRRLQARWSSQQSHLSPLLNVQAEMVIRGLEARASDPERFTLGLLPGPGWDEHFHSLMQEFTPLYVDVGGQFSNSHSPEGIATSTAMDKALQLLLWLLDDESPPDESFRQRGLNLNATPESNGWRITSKVIDGTTDEDGLMCRELGLEGKLITMSLPRQSE